MRRIKKIANPLIVSPIFLALFLPFLAFAQNPSPATQATGAAGTGITYECGSGPTAGNCTFEDAVAAVRRVTNYGAVIALGFSVVVIAYAGALYMISEGNPNKLKEATEMFRKVAIGILFILGAWLIVSLILNGLFVNSTVQFGS